MEIKSLLKNSLLIAALMGGVSAANAEVYTVDGINYEPLTENTCKVAETLVAEGVKAVEIPETVVLDGVSYTVTEIGAKAFKGKDYNTNSFITSFKLPDTIERIGSEAFAETLGNTTEFTIPASCTFIGQSAFYNTRFKTINVLGPVNTIDTQAFAVAYMTSISFPEGLVTINDFAFGNCPYLQEVELPSTVQSLGFLVFSGSNKLSKVTCLATTPPSVGMFHPQGGVTNATLYVPAGTIDSYKKANGWSSFKEIVEIAETGVAANRVNGAKVTARGGVINVEGAEGDVEVYNAVGQLLYKGAANAISVAGKGVHIVKVNGKAVKVAL